MKVGSLGGAYLCAFISGALCACMDVSDGRQPDRINSEFWKEVNDLVNCICEIRNPCISGGCRTARNSRSSEVSAGHGESEDSNGPCAGNHVVFYISSSELVETDSGTSSCSKRLAGDNDGESIYSNASVLPMILGLYTNELDTLFNQQGKYVFSSKKLFKKLKNVALLAKKQLKASDAHGLFNELGLVHNVLAYTKAVCALLDEFIGKYKFTMVLCNYRRLAEAEISICCLREIVHGLGHMLQTVVDGCENLMPLKKYLHAPRK